MTTGDRWLGVALGVLIAMTVGLVVLLGFEIFYESTHRCATYGPATYHRAVWTGKIYVRAGYRSDCIEWVRR